MYDREERERERERERENSHDRLRLSFCFHILTIYLATIFECTGKKFMNELRGLKKDELLERLEKYKNELAQVRWIFRSSDSLSTPPPLAPLTFYF